MNVLDLEEFNVLERYDSEQYYKFVVAAKEPPMFCTKCMATGEVNDDGEFLPSPFKLHDTRTRTVADVDLRGKKVVIEILQKRYKCHTAEKSSLNTLSLSKEMTRLHSVYLSVWARIQSKARTPSRALLNSME